MIPQRQRPAWTGAAALLLLGACTPLDPLPMSRRLPEGFGGSGGGGPSGPDTLVVDVMTTRLGDFIDQRPAEGAVVALDLAGGQRVERSVSADGRVRFDGMDLALAGPVAVTAYLPGYLPRSMVELTAESIAALVALEGTEQLTLRLRPRPPELVVLSGWASPLVRPLAPVSVSPTTYCERGWTLGPSWMIRVLPDTPFTLFAREDGYEGLPEVSSRGGLGRAEQWAQLEMGPVSSHTAGVQVDMTASLPITRHSCSFELPEHGITDFFERAYGRAGVNTVESAGTTLLGSPEWIDVTADGRAFEYQMHHITPAQVELPWTYHRLYNPDATFEKSRVTTPGYPEPGLRPGVLPEPVQLGDETAEITLGEQLAWQMNPVDAADPLLRLQATLRDDQDGTERWQLVVPPGTTELTLPRALPSNAIAEEVLGSKALQVFVEHCEPMVTPEAYGGLCRRWSQSLPVPVHRPVDWGFTNEGGGTP